MKKLFGTILSLMICIPAFSQHLLVLKSSIQKVIKVHQENQTSVYYSDWPDTTGNNIKAVLQNDIASLTPIASFQVDSIFAVVSTEREKRIEAKAQKEQMKRLNKYRLYFLPKASMGFYTNRLHYGGLFEAGVEAKNKYRVGLGVGYEGTNQGRGFIYTSQMPVYISGNYIVMKPGAKNTLHILLNAGYNFVMEGRFNSSRDRDIQDAYLDYTKDQLKNNVFVTIGVGVCLEDKYLIEVFYKNQTTNVTYPIDERVSLIGVNIGYKF